MSNRLQTTLAATIKRATITLPATGSTADTAANLASLSASEIGRCIGYKIHKYDTAGSSRAAFYSGDTAASMTQYTAAGEDYSEPVARDHAASVHKSASTAISNVCVVFYLMPSEG